MIRFTIPCFVRIENPQERKELDIWLRDIGYVVDRKFGSFIFARGQTAQHRHEIECDTTDGVINCGDNTLLFKALVAINNENDYMQWFVSDITGDFSFCRDEYSTILRAHGDRKATAEEIINHFKNYEINE